MSDSSYPALYSTRFSPSERLVRDLLLLPLAQKLRAFLLHNVPDLLNILPRRLLSANSKADAVHLALDGLEHRLGQHDFRARVQAIHELGVERIELGVLRLRVRNEAEVEQSKNRRGNDLKRGVALYERRKLLAVLDALGPVS